MEERNDIEMAGRPKGSTSTTDNKSGKTQAATVRKTISKTTVEKKPEQSVMESTIQEGITEPPKVEQKQYRVKKDLDPRSVVTVRNGFQGKLVYKSNRTGERYEWDAFGDEQDMELQELKNARNSSKSFFANNWFLIDDPEIVDYLGVQTFYSKALSYDKFNDLFTMTPEQIEKIVSALSSGQKQTVAYRARMLIEDGTIDSIKVINALEKSLSVELIER